MKNFKKIALGLMVGLLAVGFSAFTTPKQLTGNWYTLKSSIGNIPPSDSRAKTIANYELSSQQEDQPDCGGAVNVCAAEFANGTGAVPTDFSLRN